MQNADYRFSLRGNRIRIFRPSGGYIWGTQPFPQAYAWGYRPTPALRACSRTRH